MDIWPCVLSSDVLQSKSQVSSRFPGSRSQRNTQPRASSVEFGDHHDALHLAVAIGLQELVVVSEGNAAVRVPVGAEHVGVRQQTGAAVDGAFAADRRQAQRGDAVKQRL